LAAQAGHGFAAGHEEEEEAGAEEGFPAGGHPQAGRRVSAGHEHRPDYVYIDGLQYDLLSNQGENGSCLWNLFRASGISVENLTAAVRTANERLPQGEPISYGGYVYEDHLPYLIPAIEERTGEPMTVQLDIFYYDGRYVGRRIYGSGRGQNLIRIGLAADAEDGMGHFIMGEPVSPSRQYHQRLPGQPFYPA